jgi:hypothetical protein
MGNWWQVGASSNQKSIIVINVDIHGRTMGRLKKEALREFMTIRKWNNATAKS